MNRFYFIGLILFLCIVGCHFEQDPENEYWIKGFNEGTTTVRKVVVKKDSTFSIEIIDFYEKVVISGIWKRADDTLFMIDYSNVKKVVLLLDKPRPVFIFEKSDSLCQDKLFVNMILHYSEE